MEIQKRVGRYELGTCLGGGMAWVYCAQDTVMGRTVAVKILKEMNDGGDAKRRFLHEAQVAAKLIHENVVRVYDFGEDDQHRPYLVMEYVPGRDLGKAIKEGATGDLRARLATALRIAQALEYIHSQGIVHRDIKPDNVCVTAAGDVKLMDFGIAKVASVSMTQAGFTLGTPPYMAPEQIRSEPVTNLTDIYSFGVLLYELVAGCRAFQGDSYEAVFHQVLREPIDLEPLRKQGASQQLCKFIWQCTAKNPADRPQSFGDVGSELQKLRDTEGAAATPPASAALAATVIAPGMNRQTKLGLAATGAILCAVVALMIPSRKPENPRPDSNHSVLNPVPKAAELPLQIETSTGTMVLVPAGSFLAGEARQPSTLRDFYIDRTEVTNAAYAAFCGATGHALPPKFANDRPDLPIVSVSYLDAEAFAKWARKRLPTSHEWEKAARGTEGNQFPWGNEADAVRANVKDNPNRANSGQLMPAAAFPTSASHCGALNMVGNAWELVNETADPSRAELNRFRKSLPNLTANDRWVRIRGGSYLEALDPSVGWNSTAVPARLRNVAIGFRCVQDPGVPAP